MVTLKPKVAAHYVTCRVKNRNSPLCVHLSGLRPLRQCHKDSPVTNKTEISF